MKKSKQKIGVSSLDFSDSKEMESIFREYVDEQPIMNPSGLYY